MIFRYTHPRLGRITATLTTKGFQVTPQKHQDAVVGELLTALNRLPSEPIDSTEERAGRLAKSLRADILERHPVPPEKFDPKAIY